MSEAKDPVCGVLDTSAGDWSSDAGEPGRGNETDPGSETRGQRVLD